MSKDNMAHETDLIVEITELLDRDCTRLALVGRFAIGGDGLYGMQLVANCLWQAYQANGTVSAADPPLPPPSKPLAAQLAKVKKRLGEILKHAKVPVVVCYHLDGTGEWNLALSPDLTLNDAWDLLTNFVQDGMDFEFVV